LPVHCIVNQQEVLWQTICRLSTPVEFLHYRQVSLHGLNRNECNGADANSCKMKNIKNIRLREIDPARVGLIVPDEQFAKTFIIPAGRFTKQKEHIKSLPKITYSKQIKDRKWL